MTDRLGAARPCLHVCVTCRAGLPLAPGETPLGVFLHRAMAAAIGESGANIELRSVECLATCERGCTATIAQPGKWSYLLGGLTPHHAADLVGYAQSYAASRSGTIMPSRRAASLKDMILARFPAHDLPGARVAE